MYVCMYICTYVQVLPVNTAQTMVFRFLTPCIMFSDVSEEPATSTFSVTKFGLGE